VIVVPFVIPVGVVRVGVGVGVVRVGVGVGVVLTGNSVVDGEVAIPGDSLAAGAGVGPESEVVGMVVVSGMVVVGGTAVVVVAGSAVGRRVESEAPRPLVVLTAWSGVAATTPVVTAITPTTARKGEMRALAGSRLRWCCIKLGSPF
jgi:hypothetical protein